MGPKPITYEESRKRAISYFWSKILKTDSCWLWIGYTNGMGYGKFARGPFRYYAHRLSYEIENGEIPKGKFIRHSCDNPTCVNPGHLLIGTQQENMKDASIRKRMPTGDSCHLTKVTAENVKNLRRDYLKFKTTWADKLGVGLYQVDNIINVRSRLNG